MQKIHLLSEEVINQIAAGEVIEHPASVVKELVENSLDAGASEIKVLIESGGQRLIQIEDDGSGMSPADAALCLERHATSKLKIAADIFSLKTMGFRGEALAAIASISQTEIKTSEGGIGTWIAPLKPPQPCARNRGTTVTVRSLFYNAPARRKFQKSPQTTEAQIRKVLETVALAHPQITFSLICDGVEELFLEPKDLRGRIEEILGPFYECIMEKDLFALLKEPDAAKKQRRSQHVFVNLRPVFSPLLAKAVQAGYGTRLAEGLYPPFVLFLTVAPDAIDVNVHPQKKEIRFRDESHLFRKIENAISASFQKAQVTPSFSAPLIFTPTSTDLIFKEELSFTPPPLPSLPIALPEKPLWVEGRYLLLKGQTLCLIDLQRARSRILFDSLKSKSKDLQTLLFPIEIEAEEEDEKALKEMGLSPARIGRKKVAIEALPPFLAPEDFPEFWAQWKKEGTLDKATVRYTATSRKHYRLEEAEAIWRALQKCTDHLFDPRGERIWKTLEAKDLEKWL